MDSSNTSAYYFFIGWSIILIAFFSMLQFEGTRTLLYYLLWLLVVFDIVSHYSQIQDFLSNAGFQTSSTTPQVPVNLTGGGGVVKSI